MGEGKGWIIENNHIHPIHQKKQFTGAELAGIKIHAGIDLIIRSIIFLIPQAL